MTSLTPTDFESVVSEISALKRAPGELAVFATQQGAHWNGGLMVCGRAMNGGSESERWINDEAQSLAERAEELHQKTERIASGECSLQWPRRWTPSATTESTGPRT